MGRQASPGLPFCDAYRPVFLANMSMAIQYLVLSMWHIGMFVFGQLAALFCKARVSDPTSGFQAIKGEAIGFIASDYYPPDYPDADFLIMLNRCGFKVREIPVKMYPSRANKSMHGGPRPVYYVLKMFLSIFVTLLRKKPQI